MATSTKGRMSEQVMLRLGGGRIGAAIKFHPKEISLALEQQLNKMLRMEYLQVNIPMGEMIPNGASVASYDNILVSKYKNVSMSLLPAIPLKLPRGMGVFQIYDPNDVNCEFIPEEMGQESMLLSQPLLNDLITKTRYQWYGDRVLYNKDLTLPNETVYVSMRLVVLDISQYDDWTILPITSEQEADAIDAVYQKYMNEPIPDKLVDPGNKEQRNVPVNQQSQP